MRGRPPTPSTNEPTGNRMNALLAHNAQTPDDTRLWSPSLVEALPTRIPPLDPVAQLLAEERHERAWLRLVFSALASVLILATGASLIG